MALIECSECCKVISESASACPGCGHPLGLDNQQTDNRSVPPDARTFPLVLTAILLGLLGYLTLKIMEPRSSNTIDRGNNQLPNNPVASRRPPPSDALSVKPASKSNEPTSAGFRGPAENLSLVLLDEDIHDSLIKTQVVQQLLLEGEATPSGIRYLLENRSRDVALRTGFDHRPHPDAVYLYAFLSRDDAAKNSTAWVGMSLMQPGDRIPTITIREERLKRLAQGPKVVAGFTEAERKQIYYRLSRAEGRATKKAEKEYPGDYSRQYDYEEELLKAYRAKIRDDYGIDESFCWKVITEGVMNQWPD